MPSGRSLGNHRQCLSSNALVFNLLSWSPFMPNSVREAFKFHNGLMYLFDLACLVLADCLGACTVNGRDCDLLHPLTPSEGRVDAFAGRVIIVAGWTSLCASRKFHRRNPVLLSPGLAR